MLDNVRCRTSVVLRSGAGSGDRLYRAMRYFVRRILPTWLA